MISRVTRMFSLFLLYASLSSPAYAYLDPATGSIILQALIGAVGTAMIYYRLGLEKARNLCARVFNRNTDTHTK